MTLAPTAPAPAVPPPVRRRRRLLSWLGFPAAVTVLFLGLVTGNLNGSSIGLLGAPDGKDPNLLAGTPRSVRADELLITTPIAVSAARQGFPAQPYVGLTPTAQQAVPHGGPTWSVLEIFKPQDWGYLALGAHRGLAVHWWSPFLVSLLGVFLLLRTLSVGGWLSGALAVVATMTPYNAWWSAPAPGLALGFAALAGAAALTALRSRSARAVLAWGAAAGAATTSLLLTLYPPWLVSLGLVIAALVLGYAFDLRVGWRRPALALAGVGAVVVPATASWYLTNKDAIAATTGTFYPGQRVSQSGEATFSWLLGAPLNPLMAGTPGKTLSAERSGIPFTNLSEVSASWLPLPILAAAVLVTLVRRFRRRSDQPGAVGEDGADGAATRTGPAVPGGWTVAALALVIGLLLAWGLLPLPAWTGTVVLERVKGTRIPLALGLAGVLLVAVVGSARAPRRPRVWESAVWSVAVAGTAFLTLWAAAQLPWNDDVVSTKRVLAFALIVAVGFGLVAAGYFERAAATALAVFAAWSWALVNPLYLGLGPMDHDPVVRMMRPVTADHAGARVMIFGDLRLVGLVRSSGVQSLSGTTFYPNEGLMRRLVPDQRALWNNYVTYRWVADPAADRASIRQIKGTSMELRVDPCSPEVMSLGATWAVSDQPLDAACLRPVDEARSGPRTSRLYQVVR